MESGCALSELNNYKEDQELAKGSMLPQTS